MKKDASRFTVSVTLEAESVVVALCKSGRQEEDSVILAFDLAFFSPTVATFCFTFQTSANYNL